MSEELKERCAECRDFFENNGGGQVCRRFPPTAFLVQGMPAIALAANQQAQLRVMGEYPATNRLGWCGEYERKMEGTA